MRPRRRGGGRGGLGGRARRAGVLLALLGALRGGMGAVGAAGSAAGGGIAAAATATATAAAAAAAAGRGGGALAPLLAGSDPSWLRALREDPEAERHAPNRRSREVRSGHYVRVRPRPLPEPALIAHSASMAAALGLTPGAFGAQGEGAGAPTEAVRFFAGEQDLAPGLESWATPYALSIMGRRYKNNCPFGTGNGYGDGRALSVAEVLARDGDGGRWELQLKGAGTTPFCRGGDGRAVLRSSVREFLASEAMHALRVPTTRALVLVVSGSETAKRPWYSGRARPKIAPDDPRLARFPEHMRAALASEFNSQGGREPDLMGEEPCAITTRAATSFLRVGHVDLFSRRAETGQPEALEELRELVAHALDREFPDVLPSAPLEQRARGLLSAFGERLAAMVAGWLRVGFCQGNFNADNCLVGGRTMDYGPFGFLDEYDPLFAKWTGSGEHFAFMNQPDAGLANFGTLAEALTLLLPGGAAEAQEASREAAAAMDAAVANVWRVKFGLPDTDAGRSAAASLWPELEGLLRGSRADWTLVWRQLAEVALLDEGPDDLLEPLQAAFYAPLTPGDSAAADWVEFLRRWRKAAFSDGSPPGAVTERLRRENPKYIPREWMLVEAYDAAAAGDYGPVRELQDLFLDPYGEGTAQQAARFFRRAPDEVLEKGGVAFMT